MAFGGFLGKVLNALTLGIFDPLFNPAVPAAPAAAPEAPQVDEALTDEASRRSARRRASQTGRASTFLTGDSGLSNLGQTSRASDALNPYGTR